VREHGGERVDRRGGPGGAILRRLERVELGRRHFAPVGVEDGGGDPCGAPPLGAFAGVGEVDELPIGEPAVVDAGDPGEPDELAPESRSSSANIRSASSTTVRSACSSICGAWSR
jgi:hypothetical protein